MLHYCRGHRHFGHILVMLINNGVICIIQSGLLSSRLSFRMCRPFDNNDVYKCLYSIIIFDMNWHNSNRWWALINKYELEMCTGCTQIMHFLCVYLCDESQIIYPYLWMSLCGVCFINNSQSSMLGVLAVTHNTFYNSQIGNVTILTGLKA